MDDHGRCQQLTEGAQAGNQGAPQEGSHPRHERGEDELDSEKNQKRD